MKYNAHAFQFKVDQRKAVFAVAHDANPDYYHLEKRRYIDRSRKSFLITEIFSPILKFPVVVLPARLWSWN